MVVPPKKQTKIKPKKSTTPQLPPIPSPSSSNNGNWPSIPQKKIKKRKKAKKKKNISRIDKFNDRRQTLALLDLAKHTVLSNSFRDAKMPGGPQVRYPFFLKKNHHFQKIRKSHLFFFFIFIACLWRSQKTTWKRWMGSQNYWHWKSCHCFQKSSRGEIDFWFLKEKGYNFESLHLQIHLILEKFVYIFSKLFVY